jgi:hypothetical protein
MASFAFCQKLLAKSFASCRSDNVSGARRVGIAGGEKQHLESAYAAQQE